MPIVIASTNEVQETKQSLSVIECICGGGRYENDEKEESRYVCDVCIHSSTGSG